MTYANDDFEDERDVRDERDERPFTKRPRPAAFEIDSFIHCKLHRDLALVISECILSYDWQSDKPNTAAIAFAKRVQVDILNQGS
jgi:hypothetical protein